MESSLIFSLKIAAEFDAPLMAPASAQPFLPDLEPYVTGPIPETFKKGSLLALAAAISRLPESEAAQLIKFGSVWVDDRPRLDPAFKLAKCSSFRLNPPAYGLARFYETDADRLIFEDDDLLVYNKESGRPSQGVPHDAHNNVLAALGRFLGRRDGGRGHMKPLWLPHRLDADTSGLILLAKNKETAAALGKIFQEGQVEKEYLCLSSAAKEMKEPADIFTITSYIAKEGRHYVNRQKEPGLFSKTDFETQDETETPDGRRFIKFKARPRTGRTHQIRLHMQKAGWPIVGDRFYGGMVPAKRLMLMASGLEFKHPHSGRPLRISLND